MTKFCTECGVENLDIARFCRNCGKPFDDEESEVSGFDVNSDSSSEYQKPLQIPPLYADYDIIEESQCINCGNNTFMYLHKESFFNEKIVYFCVHCGLTFEKEGYGLRLVDISDKYNRMWTLYGSKILTQSEWERIALGGFSDEDSDENDLILSKQKQQELKAQYEKISHTKEQAVSQTRGFGLHNYGINQHNQSKSKPKNDEETLVQELYQGKIQLKPITPPIILRKKEEAYFVIPQVVLGEPPVGISAHSIGVASNNVSQINVKMIDSGTFVITNKRLVFIGRKKSISIDLKKILVVDSFKNGFSILRENKQKVDYFEITNHILMNFTIEGREHTSILEGYLVEAIISGLIAKL